MAMLPKILNRTFTDPEEDNKKLSPLQEYIKQEKERIKLRYSAVGKKNPVRTGTTALVSGLQSSFLLAIVDKIFDFNEFMARKRKEKRKREQAQLLKEQEKVVKKASSSIDKIKTPVKESVSVKAEDFMNEQKEDEKVDRENKMLSLLEEIREALTGRSKLLSQPGIISNTDGLKDNIIEGAVEGLVQRLLMGKTITAILGMVVKGLGVAALIAGIGYAFSEAYKSWLTGQSNKINDLVEAGFEKILGMGLSDTIWNAKEKVLDFFGLESEKKKNEKIKRKYNVINDKRKLKGMAPIPVPDYNVSTASDLTPSKTSKTNVPKENIKNIISNAASKHGVDKNYMMTMAEIESGFDPTRVSSTGAKGLYQFIPSTAKMYGIAGREFDPEANANAAARLTKDNKKELENRGIPASNDMLYLAHQQGVGGVSQLIKASKTGSNVSPEMRYAMDVNSGKGLSAGQFIDKWRNIYAKKEAKITASQQSSPIISAASTEEIKNKNPIPMKQESINNTAIVNSQVNNIIPGMNMESSNIEHWKWGY